MWCGVVWCGVVWYSVVWYSVVLEGTIQLDMARFNEVYISS